MNSLQFSQLNSAYWRTALCLKQIIVLHSVLHLCLFCDVVITAETDYSIDSEKGFKAHTTMAEATRVQASSDIENGNGDCAPLEDRPLPQPSRQKLERGLLSLSGQYIRSPLARAVYYKIKEDEENKNNRHVYWYRVILCRLPEALRAKFVQFDQDAGTDDFLENCVEKSGHIFTQLFYSLAKPVLGFFMTQTSINGFLKRGSMFIFSRSQFEKLLNLAPYSKAENLLDLGAGDGMVTKQMAPYFKHVYTTEMSSVMVKRLSAHGFKVLGVDEWHSTGIQYDVIACLNLLDRCDKPLTLLSSMKASLMPGTGRLLVALVIPFKPYVEFESESHLPSEYIHVKGSSFEEQVEHFVHIFDQAGLELESFSRLPYLCEGDMRHSFYVLTDAVFILKAKPEFGTVIGASSNHTEL